METYKRSLVDGKDANVLKAQQRHWLKEVRNQCQDTACLNRSYDRRIADLGGEVAKAIEIPRPTDQAIVMCWCHMDSCWWWKIERLGTVQAGTKGRLVKVPARHTSEEFSSDYVEQQGYPGFPQRSAPWDDPPTKRYLLCSKTLLVVRDYD